MNRPKVTAEDLLLYLGANGPQFPGDIAKRFKITPFRVYTLLKRDWFVNEDKGRNLSEKGRVAYRLLTDDGKLFEKLAERMASDELVPWDVG